MKQHLLALCRKRSVFTDDELKGHWNYNPYNKPLDKIIRPLLSILYIHILSPKDQI
jgi:tRNA(Ile)-lysidine synthase TilS/MesJ